MDDIFEFQSLYIAKLFGSIQWFVIVSLLILGSTYTVLKYRKISIKYFILFSLIYFSIFGIFFFKGIKVKSTLDKGEEIVKIINTYKEETMSYPNNLDKLYLESVDSNFLNCCVEYGVSDTTSIKINDEEGFHYKKIPVQSFYLIIWPNDFPRYFIYNSNEKKFVMSEIKHWKK